MAWRKTTTLHSFPPDPQRVLRQTVAGQLSDHEKTEGWLTCAVDPEYKEHVDKEANLELGHLVPHKWGSAKVSNNNLSRSPSLIHSYFVPSHRRATSWPRHGMNILAGPSPSKPSAASTTTGTCCPCESSATAVWTTIAGTLTLRYGHMRCSPSTLCHGPRSFCCVPPIQTLEFQRGKFWDDRLDSLVEKRLGQKIDAPHVPQWLFRVYKTYVYDPEVRDKQQLQLKKDACCGCKKQACTNNNCVCKKDGKACTNCLLDNCEKCDLLAISPSSPRLFSSLLYLPLFSSASCTTHSSRWRAVRRRRPCDHYSPLEGKFCACSTPNRDRR